MTKKIITLSAFIILLMVLFVAKAQAQNQRVVVACETYTLATKKHTCRLHRNLRCHHLPATRVRLHLQTGTRTRF